MFFYYNFFKNYFCLFCFLILIWLKIKFYNLFIYFLLLYRVSMIYKFVKVIHVNLVYRFDWLTIFFPLFKKLFSSILFLNIKLFENSVL